MAFSIYFYTPLCIFTVLCSNFHFLILIICLPEASTKRLLILILCIIVATGGNKLATLISSSQRRLVQVRQLPRIWIHIINFTYCLDRCTEFLKCKLSFLSNCIVTWGWATSQRWNFAKHIIDKQNKYFVVTIIWERRRTNQRRSQDIII